MDLDYHSTSVPKTVLFSASHDLCLAYKYLESWVTDFNHYRNHVFTSLLTTTLCGEDLKTFLTLRWMIPFRPDPELLEISMIGFVLEEALPFVTLFFLQGVCN